jgi:hypothetical protein
MLVFKKKGEQAECAKGIKTCRPRNKENKQEINPVVDEKILLR